MEKKNKKLQLNKETIRNLSDESLEQVAGGKRKGSSNVAISACNSCICGNTDKCTSILCWPHK